MSTNNRNCAATDNRYCQPCRMCWLYRPEKRERGVKNMENRILTLAEVLALPEGARVWVEMSRKSYFQSETHTISTAESRRITEIREPRLIDASGGWFPISAEWVNDEYRVWSLPQPPTADELAANPWGVQE